VSSQQAGLVKLPRALLVASQASVKLLRLSLPWERSGRSASSNLLRLRNRLADFLALGCNQPQLLRQSVEGLQPLDSQRLLQLQVGSRLAAALANRRSQPLGPFLDLGRQCKHRFNQLLGGFKALGKRPRSSQQQAGFKASGSSSPLLLNRLVLTLEGLVKQLRCQHQMLGLEVVDLVNLNLLCNLHLAEDLERQAILNSDKRRLAMAQNCIDTLLREMQQTPPEVLCPISAQWLLIATSRLKNCAMKMLSLASQAAVQDP